MVKIIIKAVTILTLLLVSFFAKAQDFQGKAEYKTKYILKFESDEFEVKSDEDADFKKAVDEAAKKASECDFTLIFNKSEGLYDKIEELSKPENQSGEPFVVISFSSEGKKYINLKDKVTIVEDDIYGKEFLIVENLKPLDWKLTEESKKIGEYTCLKAELIIPVTENQLKEYQEFLEKEKIKPSLFKQKEPKEKKVIAWYTPEIPVNLGPDNYWGLPGLILEINEEQRIILCSKLTLSNKAKFEIKKPSKGKVITQKEFDETLKKKNDSMKDEDGNIIFQTED
jgi:GLPGLI family protein